jgi:hypothetical protein
LGSLALLLGRDDVAIRHLEAALTRHESIGARPLAAMSQHLLATALRRPGALGDHARADALDNEATATAAALGAPRAVSSPAL